MKTLKEQTFKFADFELDASYIVEEKQADGAKNLEFYW
jgi:hypothetical protein